MKWSDVSEAAITPMPWFSPELAKLANEINQAVAELETDRAAVDDIEHRLGRADIATVKPETIIDQAAKHRTRLLACLQAELRLRDQIGGFFVRQHAERVEALKRAETDHQASQQKAAAALRAAGFGRFVDLQADNGDFMADHRAAVHRLLNSHEDVGRLVDHLQELRQGLPAEIELRQANTRERAAAVKQLAALHNQLIGGLVASPKPAMVA